MKRKALTAAVLCCCLILGLALGFGSASLLYGGAGRGTPVMSVSPIKPKSISFNISGLDGTELTAPEIYALACAQTVGVTDETNVVNAFGQLTASCVTGTGFIVSSDGYILTNYHVIENAYLAGRTVNVVFFDGSSYTAEIIGCEEPDDIAVLKINAVGLTPATIGSSGEMQVGERIYAVGNPLGELTYTMTGGIISALNREIRVDTDKTVNMFQVDAAINSGNSGGPIYNGRGQVIGIATAKYSSTGVEGLGFAIPIDTAADDASEIVKYGYVTGKPDLGIEVSSLTSAVAEYYGISASGGAYVTAVTAGSCAAKAGIEKYDAVTAINGISVDDENTFYSVLSAFSAGDTVTVTVVRRSKTLDITVTLDERRPLSERERQEQAEASRDYWDFGGFDIYSWFDSFFPSWMR